MFSPMVCQHWLMSLSLSHVRHSVTKKKQKLCMVCFPLYTRFKKNGNPPGVLVRGGPSSGQLLEVVDLPGILGMPGTAVEKGDVIGQFSLSWIILDFTIDYTPHNLRGTERKMCEWRVGWGGGLVPHHGNVQGWCTN